MVQNRLHNAPKTRFGAVLGGSKCSKIEVWRGAVRLLGASWAILASEERPGRRLRPVLGAFWSHDGAYWGALWGALGGVLRRLGVSLASFCWPGARFPVLNRSQLWLYISDAIEESNFD